MFAALVAAGCGQDLTKSGGGGSEEDFERVVLSELFTSLYCANCPEAEAALDQLQEEEEDRLAVIHWHPSEGSFADPLGIIETDERMAIYDTQFDIPGLPANVFDGIDLILGGDQTTYGEYRSRFNSEAAIRTPASITLALEVNETTAAVEVTVLTSANMPPGSYDLLVVMVEHEAPLPAGKGGSLVFSFVARDVDRFVASLGPDAEFKQDFTFDLDTGWKQEDLYVVAFLQELGQGEVFQAAMEKLIEEPTDTYDFTFSVPQTEIQFQVGTPGIAPFEIENTGTADDSLTIDFPVDRIDLPGGWSLALCTASGDSCFDVPHTLGLRVGELQGGLAVHVSGTEAGVGSLDVVVSSKGDTSLADTVTVSFTALPEGSFAFTLTAPETDITVTPPDAAVAQLIIENTGSQDDSYVIDFPRKELPQYWVASLCDESTCYGLPYTITLPFGAQEDRLGVDVIPYGDGSGWVEVVVTSVNVPTLADTVIINFATESGPTGYERVVIAELFTAVWCAKCPEAEAALDSLFEEEGTARMAAIHWHPSLSDPMGIVESDVRRVGYSERIQWLGGAGVHPVTVFSGASSKAGATTVESTYEDYHAHYEEQRARVSPAELTLDTNLNGSTVSCDIGIATMDDMSAAARDLHVVLVEHEVVWPPGSQQDPYSYVARTVTTRTVTVGGGAEVQEEVEIAVDASWNTAKLYVVAILQEPDIGEVVQSAMVAVTAPGFALPTASAGASHPASALVSRYPGGRAVPRQR
jgi:hypothetical protein